MRISAKGRYGLAAMISMAQNSRKDEYITIISISERLGISKIYLEQVFALLKRANLVVSTKGSSGGYQLTRPSDRISAFDIISAIEQIWSYIQAL
jgi:Rrf2 family protein